MSAVVGIDLSSRALDLVSSAWLAGFLDGEGSFQIVCTSRGRNYEASIAVGNTNLEALQRCKEIAGGSVCAVTNPDPQWKQSYRWNIRGKSVTPTIEALLPHLTIKREQAQILLVLRLSSEVGRSYLPPEESQWRETLYLAVRALNIRGSAAPTSLEISALERVRLYLSEGDHQLTVLRAFA